MSDKERLVILGIALALQPVLLAAMFAVYAALEAICG